MGLPRILPLFVLPQLPRNARVLGPLDSWREGLEQARIEIVDAGGADVVVAPASLAGEAVALAPAAIVLEGRPRRGAVSGYATQTLLALPDAEEPEVLVPAGEAAPVAYAFAERGGLRARVARPLLAHGIVPPPASPTVVGARTPGPPAFVAAAADLLPGPVGSWLPVLGRWGDPFSRGVLLLFPPGARAPSCALKFARIPGNRRPFDLDEQGLAVAAGAGGSVAAHAPRLLGRFTVGALEASLETATPGERMLRLLAGAAPRAEKLAVVEQIAHWLEAVAAETSGPPATLAGVRAELAGVVARWPGAPEDLVDRVADVPGVVEHGDLWAENVVLDGSSFGVLDWEAARAAGMPLWDLFYFMTSALAFVDGAASEAEKEEHFVRLFRGELPSSPALFDWTRRIVAAAGVPPDAVGPLATLRIVWLASEDLVHAGRNAAVGAATDEPLSVRHAARWLTDAALGPGWDAWKA